MGCDRESLRGQALVSVCYEEIRLQPDLTDYTRSDEALFQVEHRLRLELESTAND